MSTIRSLIVKVGAQTEEIDKALARVGSNAKKTDEDLKKLGNTPVGQAALQSFAQMEAAMNGITKAQQAVADRARLTAAGIDQIGGATKFTKTELDQLNKTLQSGIDAFRALGQAAPKDLQRVADAVTKQKKALEGTTAQTGLMGQAQSLLTSKVLAFAGPAALGAVVKQSLAYADTLTKMKDRTDIGVVSLQRLAAVATASGNTLEQVAGAVNRFQRDLASGTADDKIRSLGLSVATLRAQKPDEQFFAIARAIQSIEDPAQQTRMAMELFGRSGAEILPTLKADIDGLKDATVTMSEESVQALDDFGDMLGRWKVGAVNAIGEVTAAAITLVTNILKLPAAMRDMQDLSQMKTSVPGLIGGRGVLSDEEIKTMSPEELQRRLQARLRGDRPDVIPKPGATLPGLPTIAAPAGDELDAITKAYDRQLDKLNAIAEANKKTADAAKKAAEAYRAFKNELGIREMENYAAAQKASAQQIEENVKLEFAMNKLYIANAQAIGMYDSGIVLASKNIKPFGILVAATEKQISNQGKALQEAFGPKLRGALDDVDTILTAIPGKLSEIGAIAARTGKAIIDNLAEGDLLGAVVAGATGVVSAISKVFGPGEKGKVDDMRQAWIDASGGWNEINKMAQRAGVTLTKVLDARTVKDYEAAIADLEQAVNDVDEAVQRYGLSFADLHDEHRRLSEGRDIVEDLVDTFNDLTRAGFDADTVLSEMSGDFQGALLSLQEAGVLDDLIGDLVELGRISEDTANTLLGIGAEGPDFEALTRRASEFGINLQMLGPAFQQANITGTAQDIMSVFDDLVAAGGDAGGIMNGLKEEVSELLQGAIEFGSSIPNAMRPMIEQMARAGLLTDAAGNKIDDLSGVTFADTPLEEGLDNLNTAIRDLIAALTGDLPNAINNIPPVVVDVRYNVPDLQLPGSGTDWNMNVAAQGGLVTPDGIQRFASGGRVLPFLRRGTDTVPAMLTPGELVLNQGQQEAVRDALAGGGSPVASFKRVESLLEQMGSRAARSDAQLPHQIARYVRDAVQTAKGRR